MTQNKNTTNTIQEEPRTIFTASIATKVLTRAATE